MVESRSAQSALTRQSVSLQSEIAMNLWPSRFRPTTAASFAPARSLGLSGLLLCLALDGCASLQGGRSGPPEGVILPFLFSGQVPLWNVGSEASNDVMRLTEFVKPGETVDNWTELVTIETFNKAVNIGTVEAQMDGSRRDLVARCPGSTIEAISGQAATGLYESSVMGGGKSPDEHNITRVLDGHDNRFIVQYAVRGTKTMTPDLRAEWIKNLSAVTIMGPP